jgi:hypothetical protein
VSIRWLAAILMCFLLSLCSCLSNREYVRQYAPFQGIRRVAVFIQRWPAHLQKPGQGDLGEGFIKTRTIFSGPWQPAAPMNLRAIDIQDIDDCLMAEILASELKSKGYQVFLMDTLASESVSVEMLMAQYQAINPPVDAFLFCYYAPTVFVSKAQATPRDHASKSYSLHELVQLLEPGDDAIIWVGGRSPSAPANSISHAFIYISMTFFKALNWQTLLAEADSQVGGQVRPWIPRCPPPPTEQDYWADPGIIQRLMVNNLKCRLRHQIPYAF